MSELNQATSGAAASTSGDVNVGGTSNSTSGEAENPKHNEKLLKEKRNAMLALEEANKKIAAYEEAEMLKNKQTDQLLASYKEKLAKVETDLKQEREVIKKARINTAFLSELKKFGFVDNDANKEAAIKLASFKNVDVEPTSNTVIGVDEEAKTFYEKFSSLGLFEKRSSTTSNAAPNFTTNNGPVDLSKLSKAERLKLFQGTKIL